jgi:hypothetical protein
MQEPIRHTPAPRKPTRKAIAEKNDAQRNAARRVNNGVDKYELPIAERTASLDCDSSLKDKAPDNTASR